MLYLIPVDIGIMMRRYIILFGGILSLHCIDGTYTNCIDGTYTNQSRHVDFIRFFLCFSVVYALSGGFCHIYDTLNISYHSI